MANLLRSLRYIGEPLLDKFIVIVVIALADLCFYESGLQYQFAGQLAIVSITLGLISFYRKAYLTGGLEYLRLIGFRDGASSIVNLFLVV